MDIKDIQALSESDLEKEIKRLKSIPLDPDKNGLWSQAARDAVGPLCELGKEKQRRKELLSKARLEADAQATVNRIEADRKRTRNLLTISDEWRKF
jgi:hypothetical protein